MTERVAENHRSGRKAIMKRASGRSSCPVSFGLETFGDPWSLLVVRDVVYFGKHTFNEFLASDEAISPSVLSARLDSMTDAGILRRSPDPADRRRVRYDLTERGLGLIPVMVEIAEWGATHDPYTGAPADWIALVRDNKPEMVRRYTETVRRGGSVFVGEDSVLAQVEAGQIEAARV
jgi:DNA-binding HxlR family transcriptional regulator